MGAAACAACGAKPGVLSTTVFFNMMGQTFCETCAAKTTEAVAAKVMTSTTETIPGLTPVRHFGVETFEVVLTSAPLQTETLPRSAHLRGYRSGALENLVHLASRVAVMGLQVAAFQLGGNAVVGVSISCSVLSQGTTGIIAAGTVVECAPAT